MDEDGAAYEDGVALLPAVAVMRNDASLPAMPDEKRCPRNIDMMPELEVAEDVELRVDLAIFAGVFPASVLDK